MQPKENVTDMQHHEQQLSWIRSKWPWLLVITIIAGCCTLTSIPSHMGCSYVKPFMQPRKVRLLAFGDSLTAGYYAMGMAYHPYSNRLKQLALQHNLTDFEVDTMGVPGEVVLPDMVNRLNTELARAKERDIQYTHVVIFGGTNDIGGDADAVPVFEQGLKPMYQTAMAHGAHVVAMTLMGMRPFEMYQRRLKPQAEQLNAMIRQYVRDNQKKSMSLVDMEAVIATQLTSVWDDNLHLTPQGYDLMGQHVWDEVLSRHVGVHHG